MRGTTFSFSASSFTLLPPGLSAARQRTGPAGRTTGSEIGVPCATDRTGPDSPGCHKTGRQGRMPDPVLDKLFTGLILKGGSSESRAGTGRRVKNMWVIATGPAASGSCPEGGRPVNGSDQGFQNCQIRYFTRAARRPAM